MAGSRSSSRPSSTRAATTLGSVCAAPCRRSVGSIARSPRSRRSTARTGGTRWTPRRTPRLGTPRRPSHHGAAGRKRGRQGGGGGRKSLVSSSSSSSSSG
eukprot:5520144-Alexandrium_andersonii.AAC.1